MLRPIPESYWVTPGLLAGEYPGARDPVLAQRKVRRLLSAGVTCFIDLTEAGEYRLRPYLPLVHALAAAGSSIDYRRYPIPDMGVPDHQHMIQILDWIDAALAAAHVIYVHCWGGIGRTGMVVGCYLVRHGHSSESALQELVRLRAKTPDGHRASPETGAQRQFVLTWREL